MELSLRQELEKLQRKQPDTSKGMAWIFFKGNPCPVGLFTVAFAQDWCSGDCDYRWERA